MTNSFIQRTALLPYTARDMYLLVNDIAAYPSYMDGCVGAEVLARDEGEMVARLDLAKAGVRQSFTTRNQLVPLFQSVGGNLVDALCKRAKQIYG